MFQDEYNFCAPSRSRAGHALGRCHAALGQFELSASAFDSALSVAKAGRWLFSEVLTTRGRAVAAGRMAGDAGPYWSETEGRQRLAEVVGRMRMPEEERQAFEAALLSQPWRP